MDYGTGEVYILDDEWKFISSKYFDSSNYMISIDNSLYMTGSDNVWKVDKDLKILVNYNPGGDPIYRGISYNPSNGFIYVVAYGLNEIQVFNLDLTLQRHLSTSPHSPYSITFSSNQLYVGTYGGIILVYQNEILINQFDGCSGNSGWLRSILFDLNGNMATSCYRANKLYLFAPDGSVTGKSYVKVNIGYDSKGRFIQISKKQIRIYN